MGKRLRLTHGPDRLDLMQSLASSKLEPESRLLVSVSEDDKHAAYYLWVIGMKDTDGFGFRLELDARVYKRPRAKEGEPEPPEPRFIPHDADIVYIGYNLQDKTGTIVFA